MKASVVYNEKIVLLVLYDKATFELANKLLSSIIQ